MLFRSKLFTLLIVSLFVGGCAGPKVLSSSFMQYSNSYASANNQQMLLNLARLHNLHPPFFLQLGGVTAQFSFNAGLSAGYDSKDDGLGGILPSQNYGLNLGASESPVFSFTPMTGHAFANSLIKPLDPNIMFIFSNQNIPISTLARMMVQEIILVFPKTNQHFAFYNGYFPEEPENYADFLRIIAALQRLQRTVGIKAKAAKEGEELEMAVPPHFIKQLHGGMRIGNQTIHIDALKNVNFDTAGEPVFYFKTKTYINVLTSLAFDADKFAEFKKDHPDFIAGLPPTVRSPIMQIQANPDFTEPHAAKLSYAGKDYIISDVKGSYQNRSAFAILQFLASQVALDPKDLPTQQLIQVR